MKIEGSGDSNRWKWFQVRPASSGGEVTPVQPIPKVVLPERPLIVFGPEIKKKIKGEAIFASQNTEWDLFLDKGWVFSNKVLEILFRVLKIENNEAVSVRLDLKNNSENAELRYGFLRNNTQSNEINSYSLKGQLDVGLAKEESLFVLNGEELMYLITNSGLMEEDHSKIVLALGTNNKLGLKSSSTELIPMPSNNV